VKSRVRQRDATGAAKDTISRLTGSSLKML